MQVKNTTKKYQGFTIRTNPDEMVEGQDSQGNPIKKLAMPRLLSVRIPGLTTVEIDDDYWRQALKIKSRRQKVELSKDPVTVGTDRADKPVEHFITTPNGDGIYRTYYPVVEMVKSGVLEVIKQPELGLTEAQMRKAIVDAQGFALPDDVEPDVLEAHYYKVVG